LCPIQAFHSRPYLPRTAAPALPLQPLRWNAGLSGFPQIAATPYLHKITTATAAFATAVVESWRARQITSMGSSTEPK